ncbi:hypothetical protein BDV96DRAFT_653047 [Lophiotrema nucula]|uniref:Uncharacterized protein n=1 Tax=Lophiotrema nucula TaxID=690887 RepID=A0A6A5YMF6_9PLEO|nr:hypothetical protein BDV96DRAFT_653047 [Lophiotrema nucula]
MGSNFRPIAPAPIADAPPPPSPSPPPSVPVVPVTIPSEWTNKTASGETVEEACRRIDDYVNGQRAQGQAIHDDFLKFQILLKENGGELTGNPQLLEFLRQLFVIYGVNHFGMKQDYRRWAFEGDPFHLVNGMLGPEREEALEKLRVSRHRYINIVKDIEYHIKEMEEYYRSDSTWTIASLYPANSPRPRPGL